MNIKGQIEAYLASQPEPKRSDMQELHRRILAAMPGCRLWFLDGKDGEGRTVSNPNIGYGIRTMEYADGKSREFYQIGLSANTSGISVYILGIKDKAFLAGTYGKKIGKASVTGYCIKFKGLKDISVEILEAAIRSGLTGASDRMRRVGSPKDRESRRGRVTSGVNKAWHEKNKMPAKASLAVRAEWHLEHRKKCGCREMPETVAAYLRKKKAAPI